MAKTVTSKVGKPLNPKSALKQDDTAYLVRADLEEEKEQLRKAAAAGANVLKTPAPLAPAEHPPGSAIPNWKWSQTAPTRCACSALVWLLDVAIV
jgi:hypothetical protein